MADEPVTLAAVADTAPAETAVATPQSDPTPAQVESKSLIAQTSGEIDDLWGKLGGLRPDAGQPAEREAPPAEDASPPAETGRQRDEKGRFVKPEAQPAETPTEPVAGTPPPTADPAEIERQVRERIDREQQAARDAEEKIRAEQRFHEEVGYYSGLPADRDAVAEALREYNLGNPAPLDALDVVLPNGKRVSEIMRPDGSKGPGLTAAEAQNLANSWGQADRYGDALADRKIQQVIGYWDAQTQSALADPDVDAARVREYRTPGEQIKAAIDTTRERVTARLAEAHQKVVAEKDAEIATLTERVKSLVNERGNLTSQQMAASAATPDRPGQPGSVRRDLPTPDQLRDMSADEAFRSGAIDRLLQSIPGGFGPRQARRVG